MSPMQEDLGPTIVKWGKAAPVSCAECRRLKIKCDREFPCRSCVKRGCEILCPNQTTNLKDLLAERQRLIDQVKSLQVSSNPVISSGSLPPPVAASDPPPSSQFRPAPCEPWSRIDDSPDVAEQSRLPFSGQSGTLAVSQSGRIKFVGASAGAMSLRESAYDTLQSRYPSPSHATSSGPPEPRPSDPADLNPAKFLQGFPFAAPPSLPTFSELYSQMPHDDEVDVLVSCYYRHAAWNGTPVLREAFDEARRKLNERSMMPDHNSLNDTDFHRLALLYIVLAYGTLMNTERPPHHPLALVYCSLSQRCLAAGRFLVSNTLTAIQAMVIMGRFMTYSSLDGGRDLAWQMWGLVARMMQASGLHRDGERWQLEPGELDQRRRIFWEVYATEVCQSLGWGRPNALNPRHFDTQYPVDHENPLGDPASCGFSVMRYEIARIVQDILDHAMESDNPSYGRAIGLWQRVIKFEDTTPFRLRCRAAMRANITRYPTQQEADLASPEARPDDMRLCFQQHALAQGSCAAIFSIFRPFFVAALSQNAADPFQTPYGQAYLVVVERCCMLISLVESLYALAPVISARHWFFWAHAFNAGVCLATLCIASPGNPLAPLALSRLSNVQALLHQVSQTLNLPLGGISKNLECLRSLEKHAVRNRTAFLENRPVQSSGLRSNLELVNNATPLPNEVDPSALIGWQTRLVKMSPDEHPEGAVLAAGNGSPPCPLPRLGRTDRPHASPNSTIAGPISDDSLVNRSHPCQEFDRDLGNWTDPDTLSELLGLPPLEWPFPPVHPPPEELYFAYSPSG